MKSKDMRFCVSLLTDFIFLTFYLLRINFQVETSIVFLPCSIVGIISSGRYQPLMQTRDANQFWQFVTRQLLLGTAKWSCPFAIATITLEPSDPRSYTQELLSMRDVRSCGKMQLDIGSELSFKIEHVTCISGVL